MPYETTKDTILKHANLLENDWHYDLFFEVSIKPKKTKSIRNRGMKPLLIQDMVQNPLSANLWGSRLSHLPASEKPQNVDCRIDIPIPA